MESTGLHFFSTIFLCIFINPYYAGSASNSQNYYGKLIGNLTHYAHDVNGTAYAVDESTIFIKNFSYDGMVSAFFWVGNESAPSPYGIMVPYPSDKDEREEPKPLGKFRNKDIILKLPSGIKIRDIKWLCVWYRRFTVNLGSVNIPPDLEVPKIRVLPEFLRLAHGLRSGNISILDSKTFYIPNLHYDGTGPDAYFWVGTGKEPNTLGIKVPSETKSLEPLRGYQGEDIEIVLPDNLTVYDIDWLAVWCVEYRHNFGHVIIPKNLDVPPALGQTQITPPWWYNPTSTPSLPPNIEHDLSNCKEMLEGRLQVQWEVFGDDVKIRISARIDEDQYVAFGLSGEDGKSQMLGGDVVVVAYDKHSKKFFAEDYYLSDLSQCDGKRGVCPDERIGGKNDAIYIDGKRNNGITTVIYMRPLQTNEPEKDKIIPETYTSVIAAIGTLNSNGEANTHQSSDRTTEDIRIDFNSKNVHECTNSLYNLPESNEIDPWPIIEVMDTDEFTVRIGPTGGKRGYSYITGQTNWGIAWYINDLLIPEVYVERGQNYTFIVEGGNDPSNPARYNPFYITDSAEGGLAQKNKTEQEKQKVYAGVEYDEQGYPYPTAVGRYCSWNHKTVDMSAESRTFKDFFKTLKLECDPGESARLVWSVADDTPDLLYYQSYSHINLGWKIHVVDPGYSSHRNSGSTMIPTTWTITLASFLGFYKILLLVR